MKKFSELNNFHWLNWTQKLSSVILPNFCPGRDELDNNNHEPPEPCPKSAPITHKVFVWQWQSHLLNLMNVTGTTDVAACAYCLKPGTAIDRKWTQILTHWGPVMHICVGKLTTICSDNGLLPVQAGNFLIVNTMLWLDPFVTPSIIKYWTDHDNVNVGIQSDPELQKDTSNFTLMGSYGLLTVSSWWKIIT